MNRLPVVDLVGSSWETFHLHSTALAVVEFIQSTVRILLSKIIFFSKTDGKEFEKQQQPQTERTDYFLVIFTFVLACVGMVLFIPATPRRIK